jgi:predicted nucleotidyltransferase
MSVDDDVALVDAVVYGDAFDCAVNFEEIWHYSRVPVTAAELRARLIQPPLGNFIGERAGFYFLAGREDLANLRTESLSRAHRLHKRARSVARWLQHVPFVRGIVLTGSVAAGDARDDADVDILVLVAPDRIGLVFALLGSLSRLVSRKIFCPNYYLSAAHLTLPRRDHYVARELMQAQPLTQGGEALLAANSWTQEDLPNASASNDAVKPLPGGTALQRVVEAVLSGGFGQRCDRGARRLVIRRLTAHYASFGSPVPEEIRDQFERGIELRFHGAPRVNLSIERYATRRAELANRIRETSATGADA